MPKVEILVDNIFGENGAQYRKGDVVEVSADTAKVFGDRCKVLDKPAKKAPAKKAPAKKAAKDEG